MTEIKEKKPRKSRTKKAIAEAMIAPLEVETAITLPVKQVFKTQEETMLEAISAEIAREKRTVHGKI